MRPTHRRMVPEMASPAMSPWGTPDAVTDEAPGMWWYQTPSHGGYWLSPERRASMPEALKCETFAGGPWYEEDCDWAIVVCAFPDDFEIDVRATAYDALHRWKPAVFAAHYGEYLRVTS